MNAGSGPTANLPENTKCRQCGYALRDLPEPRCPECGAAFDPADPQTYAMSSFASRLRRHFQQPPPLALVAVHVAYVPLVLVVASDPSRFIGSPTFGSPMFFMCWLFPLLVYGVVDYVVRLALRPRLGEKPRFGRRSWRWAAMPLAALAMLLAVSTDWPFAVRFALSRRALEGAAEQVRRTGQTPATPTMIGLYRVTDVFNEPNCVIFMIDEPFNKGGILFKTGLAHRPDGDAPHNDNPIARDWYDELRCLPPGATTWQASP